MSELFTYIGCGCVGGMVFLLVAHWLVIAPLDRHAARLERELEDVQQRPTWPSAGKENRHVSRSV